MRKRERQQRKRGRKTEREEDDEEGVLNHYTVRHPGRATESLLLISCRHTSQDPCSARHYDTVVAMAPCGKNAVINHHEALPLTAPLHPGLLSVLKSLSHCSQSVSCTGRSAWNEEPPVQAESETIRKIRSKSRWTTRKKGPIVQLIH